MANLQHTVKSNLNIATEAEVLSYSYSGLPILQVASRAVLGDTPKPIVGGGIYSLRVYVNNILVTPTTDDNVPIGVIKTMVVSRPIPLVQNDVLSIRIIGQPGDTAVDTVADLYDATSITVSDVQGSGTTIVDTNYGGTNNLAYFTSTGQPIAGATILIYLTNNYINNLRTSDYVLARAQTIGDGSWNRPVMLSNGNYTLIYYLQGLYGPDRKDITV